MPHTAFSRRSRDWCIPVDSLITDAKQHTGLIHPILVKSEASETNERVVCSGSTSGTATTPDGGTKTYIGLSSDSVCRQLADVHNETAMGMSDPVQKPEEWQWSSFRAYAYGEAGLVRINDWSVLKMKVRAV